MNAGSYRLEIHRTVSSAPTMPIQPIEMGAPRDLKPAQLDELKKLTRDLPEAGRVVQVGEDGPLGLSPPMRSNDVVQGDLGEDKEADVPTH